MNKENTEKLFNDFPSLYRSKNDPETKTLMGWGFSCDDGWFDLIYDLSSKLERCITELSENKIEDCYAFQVKEKFGSLRFYMSNETKEMSDFIREAETKSSYTCEACGSSKGQTSRSATGWIRTLCSECEKINE